MLKGKQSIEFHNAPYIISSGCVAERRTIGEDV